MKEPGRMNLRPVLILAGVALAIVAGAVWFLQTPPGSQAPLPPIVSAQPDRSAPPVVVPERQGITMAPPAGGAPPVRAADVPHQMAEWEIRIDNVLRSGVNEDETAQVLANMLPTLPPDGQPDAAQHISNLTLDPQYARLGTLMRNTNLSREVQDVLMTDLMNRGDEVKLPTLLDVAKLPAHPHQEEALTTLQVFLDVDYGTDWPKWDAAMKDYLRKQKAEEDAFNAAEAAAPPPAPAPGR